MSLIFKVIFILVLIKIYIYMNVKWYCYRSGLAQRVGRGIALLFHDRDTRKGWVVSSTLRPHFTPRKDPVPILQEVGWAPGPVWTDGKSRPHLDSIPDRPARSQFIYPLSYPAHTHTHTHTHTHIYIYIYIYIYIWMEYFCTLLVDNSRISQSKILKMSIDT